MFTDTALVQFMTKHNTHTQREREKERERERALGFIKGEWIKQMCSAESRTRHCVITSDTGLSPVLDEVTGVVFSLVH